MPVDQAPDPLYVLAGQLAEEIWPDDPHKARRGRTVLLEMCDTIEGKPLRKLHQLLSEVLDAS